MELKEKSDVQQIQLLGHDWKINRLEIFQLLETF